MRPLLFRLTAVLTFVVGLSLYSFFQASHTDSQRLSPTISPSLEDSLTKQAYYNVLVPPLLSDENWTEHCGTIYVSINKELKLNINGYTDVGIVNDPSQLQSWLSEIIKERTRLQVYNPGTESRSELPGKERILKTVHVLASKTVKFGDLIKVLGAISAAGASPIKLDIDSLPYRLTTNYQDPAHLHEAE